MRRISIEAEISARSYKKLVEQLKGYNKKQLWKVLDHYIFHIMEDKHVEELLQILKTFKDTDSFDEPAEVAAQFEMASDPIPSMRPSFTTPITAEDMKASRDKMDLLYDVNYFTYLSRDVAVENAKRLIAYAKDNSLAAQPHWHLVASSSDFFDIEDEEGE